MSTVIRIAETEVERNAPLTESEIRDAVEVLKALAHPIRLGIVQLLADKAGHGIEDETCCQTSEVCVCKITELFEVSMATISHHLKLLREAGLLESRRDGAWIYYSLKRDELRRVAWTLDFVAALGESN